MSENYKSIIYISKRCPYCRKLLLLLQGKPELKGSIKIVSVDDEPFPKIVKSVPTMISNGEIWTSDELFAVLEGKNNEEKQEIQPQQGLTPDDIGLNHSKEGETDNLNGYSNDGLSLGFAPLDESFSGDSSNYASIDTKEEMLDVTNDGYVKKNKKTEQFDTDYERMMAERGEITAGSPMGGGGRGL